VEMALAAIGRGGKEVQADAVKVPVGVIAL
jgi:hypothetical protein